MKKNALTDIKKSELKDLMKMAVTVRKEIALLELDKVAGKITDFKSIAKKRADLAQLLTVLRQKELLEQLTKKEVQDAG